MDPLAAFVYFCPLLGNLGLVTIALFSNFEFGEVNVDIAGSSS